MADLRTAAQQALEALENAEDQLAKPYSTDASNAITALSAALAQQVEPQDAELSAALGWPGGISEPVLDRKVLLQKVAALEQQTAPDHETRAELAEQQVVQLAEERDHYRNLWQKAQQAEPVKRKPLTDAEIDKLMQSIGLRCADEGNPLMSNHAEWQRRTIAGAIKQAHGIKGGGNG